MQGAGGGDAAGGQDDEAAAGARAGGVFRLEAARKVYDAGASGRARRGAARAGHPRAHAARDDFGSGDFKPFNPTSTAELLEKFDRNIEAAAGMLEKQPDDRMGEPWKLRSGDHVLFEMPRALVVRFVGLNHVVHHRGQLSVYLRLLDVPLPSIYGPSADETGA